MIDAIKESLCINKAVGNKTFQITIEGDSIIPDMKPDILSAISTCRKCLHLQKGDTRRKDQTRWKYKYIFDVLSRRRRSRHKRI